MILHDVNDGEIYNLHLTRTCWVWNL